MKLTLVLLLLYGSLHSQNQEKIFSSTTKATNPEQIKIETFSTLANCKGPNGSYTTLVESFADKIYFEQNFSYRDEPSIISSEGNISDFQGFFAHAHHFIKQAIYPSYMMLEVLKVENNENESIINGKTWLGHSLVLTIDSKTHLPLSYSLIMDGEAPIDVSFSKWKLHQELFIPFQVKIIQGDEIFEFDYQSIQINGQLQKLNR